MLSGIVYASKVAFGECGEVTPTGESLSQMEKENGKSFSKEGFMLPRLPEWMNNISKKMAANLPSHWIEGAHFSPGNATLRCFRSILAWVSALYATGEACLGLVNLE